MVLNSSFLLQALFAAAIWAIPLYALFRVLDSVVSKKVPNIAHRTLAYFFVITVLLALIRTSLVLPTLSCPPAVRASNVDFTMEPAELTCNYWLNVLSAFVESLWKSAYISLLIVLFALVGYAVSEAIGIRSPHIRGYLATIVAVFLFTLALVVFPWVCAGWVSSSL